MCEISYCFDWIWCVILMLEETNPQRIEFNERYKEAFEDPKYTIEIVLEDSDPGYDVSWYWMIVSFTYDGQKPQYYMEHYFDTVITEPSIQEILLSPIMAENIISRKN